MKEVNTHLHFQHFIYLLIFHNNLTIYFGFSLSLLQAKLFRIFQRVLSIERDAHHEELRRLGIYIVRKFVEVAPTNPKIYAELLFWKSVKEANELEGGYCDAYEP